MNTTELIELAEDVADDCIESYCGMYYQFHADTLQQFVQRIEQPLLELVDQLNKKIDWQIEAISAQQAQIAEYAVLTEENEKLIEVIRQRSHKIAELEKDAEILQTNLDAALMQVRQLRDELRKSYTLHYQVLHDLITRAQQNAYLQKLEDDEFHEAVIDLSDSLISKLEGYARKALEETK